MGVRAWAAAGAVGAVLIVAAWATGHDTGVDATSPGTSPAQASGTTPVTEASTPAAPAPTTTTATGRRAPAARPGDLVISGVTGLAPSTGLLSRARHGQIAGVILMGDNISSVRQVRHLTRTLQTAAHRGGFPPLLVMTDQEGGTVKRFPSAAPSHSARELAALPLSEVEDEGRRTGKDLRARGVNVNLASVADVPTSATNFLGTRAFGTSPTAVARNACRFAQGLRDAGVAATLKHFPGLGGAATINTDDAPVRIALAPDALAASWRPYRRCGAAPATLTMVSNAEYAALGGGRPAVLAPDTYATARRIGVRGPYITDSLDAGAVRGIAGLAAKAVNAGGDLMLYTSEGGAITGERQIRRGVPAAILRARAKRVRALREELG